MSNLNATINITLHHDNFSVSCGELAAPLTPKDFAILQSFKDSKTETLSRQTLIQTHFPQSNVNGEQLLNNAIYRMRLGLRAVTELDNPIITVHKKGYKLHKALYLQEDEFAKPNPADTRRLMLTSLTSASLIFGVLVIAIILNVTAESTPEPLEPENALPLTSTLLLQQRTAPQVSSDGEYLTYVGIDLQGNHHLYQQALQAEDSPLPVQISNRNMTNHEIAGLDMTGFADQKPLNENDFSAGTWSPDNAFIAFTSRAEPGTCRVKIYSKKEESITDLARCHTAQHYYSLKKTTAWSPDGNRLYFISTEAASPDKRAHEQNRTGNLATASQASNQNTTLAYFDTNTQQIVAVQTNLKPSLQIAQPTVLNEDQIAFTVTDKKDQMRIAIHDLQSGQSAIAHHRFLQIRGMAYLPERKQILLSAKTANQFQMFALQLPTNELTRLLILSSHDLVEPSVNKDALYFAEEHQIRHNITVGRQGKLHLPFLDTLNTAVNAYTQPLLTNRAVFFTYQLAQQWHLGFVQRNKPEIVSNVATHNQIKPVSHDKGFTASQNGNHVVYVNKGENTKESLAMFDIESGQNDLLLTANNNLWNFHQPFWSECDNTLFFSAAHTTKSYHYRTNRNPSANAGSKSNAIENLRINQHGNQHNATHLHFQPDSNTKTNTLYGWQYDTDSQQLQSVLDQPASKMLASSDCRYLVYTNRDRDGISLYDRIQQQTVEFWPYMKRQHYQLISHFNDKIYFVADYQGKHALYRSSFVPFNPEMLYTLPMPERIAPHAIQALDNEAVMLSYSTTKSVLQKVTLDELN